MSALLIVCFLLTAGASFVGGQTAVVFGSPDLISIVNGDPGGFVLEAFKAASNDRDLTTTSHLRWFSIGQPRLARPPLASGGRQSASPSSVFQFGPDRVSVWINLLTPRLRHDLATAAKAKYHRAVSDGQISLVPLTHANCSITTSDADGNPCVLRGSAADLRSVPLRVDFSASHGTSSDRQVLEESVSSRRGISLACTLQVRVQPTRDEPLRISQATIEELGIVGKLFGRRESVTVTREQLWKLGEDVYDALADDVGVSFDEFIDGFMDGVLRQTQAPGATGMGREDVVEAMSLLSTFPADKSGSRIKLKELNKLLRLTDDQHGQQRIAINDDELEKIGNRGSTHDLNGDYVVRSDDHGVRNLVFRKVLRLGNLLHVVSSFDASDANVTRQLELINSLENSALQWERRGNSIVAKTLRVAQLFRNRFRRDLSFSDLRRSFGDVLFSRNVDFDAYVFGGNWTGDERWPGSVRWAGSRDLNICEKKLVAKKEDYSARMQSATAEACRVDMAQPELVQVTSSIDDLERRQSQNQKDLSKLKGDLQVLNTCRQRVNGRQRPGSGSSSSSTTGMSEEDKKDWSEMALPLLLLASRKGYVDKVRMLAEEGTDLSTKDGDGRTALHEACLHGKMDVVQMLLDYGADVNAKDKHGSTPLIIASQTGFSDLVQLLLDYNAEANARNNDGNTALSVAADKTTRSILAEDGGTE